MILKAISCTNKTLDECYDYVCDTEKTHGMVGTYGCGNKAHVRNMKSVKIAHNKNCGIECAHFVLSPAPYDNVTPKRMLDISRDFAMHFKKHQAVFAVHQDTDVIHAHILLNSVAFDGTRFRQFKPQLAALKNHVSNCICPKYGISGITGCVIRTDIAADSDMEFSADELSRLSDNANLPICSNFPISYDEDDFDTDEQDYYDLCDYDFDDDYDTEERIDIMKNTLAEHSKFNAPTASDKRIRVYNQFNINANTAKEAKEYTDTLFSAIPAYIKDLDHSCGGKENLDVYNTIDININSSSYIDAEYDCIDESETDCKNVFGLEY